MQCGEFDNRLHRLLDARIAPEGDPQLTAHADCCATCRSVLVTQQELYAGLRVPIDGPRDEFAYEVLDQALRTRNRSRQTRKIMLALAVAAALVIALLPFAGRPPQVADNESGVSRKVVGLTVAPPSTPRQRSEQEGEEFRALLRHLLDGIAQRPLEAWEPVDQLSDGFRPLAVTFHVAFDALRRTLPGQQSHNPHEPPQAFRQPNLAPLS